MQLKDLRPEYGADLARLSLIVNRSEWEACLPSKLDEPMLLALARDFRCVETGLNGGAGFHAQVDGLAAALCVSIGLLSAHPARRGNTQTLDIPLEHLWQALHVYQFGLERELVARIIGISTPNADYEVVEALRRFVDA